MMEADPTQNFNERLNHWVASQGFWFQMRHSLAGGDGWTMAVFHLMRMGLRLLIVVALGAGAYALYLIKEVNSVGFRDEIRERFVASFAATDGEISGFGRSGGRASVRRLGAEGGPDSFFESLEAANVNFDMGLLDARSARWDAGVVRANWMDLKVKAGVNSADEAAAVSRTLFGDHPKFSIEGLEVSNARIGWGYESRAGEIEGSKLSVNRLGDGWRLNFKGGRFTQSWIKQFEIEELMIDLTPGGVEFGKGLLRSGAGTVEFKDVKVSGGELPLVSGSLVLRQVPLDRLLPEKIGEMIGGSISGELALGGSTNSRDGVTFEGRLEVLPQDVLFLRSSIHLLEALDMKDVYNSYKRVEFDSGGFELRTAAGELVIANLELVSKDFLSITGALRVKRPSESDAASALGERTADFRQAIMMSRGDDSEQGLGNINLRGAGRLTASDRKETLGKAPEIDEDTENAKFFAGIANRRQEAERLWREASERALNMQVVEGAFQLTLPGDAFERFPKLQAAYPADETDGRIRMDVPLNGGLFDLTVDQADEILRLGIPQR